MILPNFIILGAAKAGTTALYHYLQQHPEIGMSRIKETNYLALKDDTLDFRGPGDCDYIRRFTITTEAGYHDQFAHCAGKKAVGEASPLYLYDPKVPGEIEALVPTAKLIAILRNPVDRAYSAFLHLIRDRRETTADFLEALQLEPSRIDDRWEHIWHYIAMGRYAEQLERYLARFPREQIRVILYDDFRADPASVLTDIIRFLEVGPGHQFDLSIRHNEGLAFADRPRLCPAAAERIRESLRDDTDRLASLLSRDLSHWTRAK